MAIKKTKHIKPINLSLQELLERLENIKEQIQPSMTFTQAWNCTKLVVDLINDITKEVKL